MEGLLTIKEKDLDRLEILQGIKNQKFTKIEGAKLLKISNRQLRRIWQSVSIEKKSASLVIDVFLPKFIVCTIESSPV